MNLIDKFHFVKDDFEIIERLKKLSPDPLTNNQQILRHIQEESHGKDYGALFGDQKYTYVLYKYGNIEDSGLFMIYVANEDAKFLKMYVENAEQVLPNKEIRLELLRLLTQLVGNRKN